MGNVDLSRRARRCSRSHVPLSLTTCFFLQYTQIIATQGGFRWKFERNSSHTPARQLGHKHASARNTFRSFDISTARYWQAARMESGWMDGSTQCRQIMRGLGITFSDSTQAVGFLLSFSVVNHVFHSFQIGYPLVSSTRGQFCGRCSLPYSFSEDSTRIISLLL
ncbi:hypothetical protein EV426DRAFT_376248 [Tirmania nivea]|nr:hypothetical protein EV426DRAFT_376248 [Tirmania nivea]